jgi:hypothetical protein
MRVVLHQALYGYDQGHKQLAASTNIDREAGRVLRAVTDLKVGSPDRTYLTVVPLPSLAKHAFVRTWSAGSGFRPGSVWSHVLLMSSADLEAASDLNALLSAFVRPDVEHPGAVADVRERYREPMTVDLSSVGGRTSSVVHRVARGVIEAAYGPLQRSDVVVDRASEHESLLLDLLTQEWPALRRSTAVRTRHRKTESSAAAFAVEIVERSSTKPMTSAQHDWEWAELLAWDLEIPNGDARRWLHRFGPDAGIDRRSVPPLVAVCVHARAGNVESVLDSLVLNFPEPTMMPTLKHELFGAADPHVDGVGWPVMEEERIALAMRIADHLDTGQLDLPERFSAVLQRDESAAIELVGGSDWSDLSDALRQGLLGVLVLGLTPSGVARAVIEQEGLADELLLARPDAWAERVLWSSPSGARRLQNVLATVDADQLSATFLDLVLNGPTDAAMLVAQSNPTLWWALLAPKAAEALIQNSSAVKRAGKILALIPTEGLGDPPFGLESRAQRQLIVNVAPPDRELWRRIDPAELLDILLDQSADPKGSRLASQVLAIASAEQSKNLGLRERAWLATFSEVHRGLEGNGAPAGSERTLDRALPGGSNWDWCGRLREGLARIAVDANWTPERIHEQARGAGDYTTDVAERVKRRVDKNNGGLLEGLVRLFWP